MRRRLLVAGAAALLVAAGALGTGMVLRDEAEDSWRRTLDQLEGSLGPDATISYGALEVALFARGGTVRDLAVAAPGLQEPFTLTVDELVAEGLVPEGAAGLRLASGSARGLELTTRQGRWQLERLTLERMVIDDSTLSGPQAWTRRLGFEAGRLEQLSFDRTRALPAAAPPVDAPEPAGVVPAAPPGGTGLAGSLARADLGTLEDGYLSRLRFERLLLDAGEARQLAVAHGGLEGLDLSLVVSGLAGRLLPARLVLEDLRLEGGTLRGDGSEVAFASLVAGQSAGGEAGGVVSELTVEGLTTSASDPALGAYWAPIETAGHGTGFRLHGVLLTEVEAGRLELRSLLVELPEAASLELAADLRGLDLRAAVAEPGRFAEIGLRGSLASAGLVAVDAGGLDAVLSGAAGVQGMTARQLRQVAAFQVAEALRQGQVPRDVGMAVQDFLADPGRLEIRLRPEDPAPLLALAMLALAPEQAAEQLGITATSGPAGD
jgi:hypothetical protein